MTRVISNDVVVFVNGSDVSLRRQDLEVDDQHLVHDVTSLADVAEEVIVNNISTVQITHKGFVVTETADNFTEMATGRKDITLVAKSGTNIQVGDIAVFGRGLLSKGYSILINRKDIVGSRFNV